MKLELTGREARVARSDSAPGPISAALGLRFETDAAFDVARARGAATPRIVDLEPLRAAHAVVEIELAGGLRLYRRLEELETLAGVRPARGERGTLSLPRALPLDGSGTRGVGDAVIEGVRFLVGRWLDDAREELLGKGSAFAMRRIAELVDRHLVAAGDRLCPVLEEGTAPTLGAPVAQIDAAGDAPILVFVHGTISSTAASFGGLWQDGGSGAPIARLRAPYGSHVYALEHRTLTRSPLDNALVLARALPRGARVHLVTYSRGGIVGELLCRGRVRRSSGGFEGPFDDRELAALGPYRSRAEMLGRVLAERELRVERFLRVASPVRGTTLLSERLDRFLELGLNLLGRTAGVISPPAAASAALFRDILLAMLRTRADASVLPGLDAMRPDAPLVRVLNRPGSTLDADLSVIAGDIAGRGLLGNLAVFATDRFYRSEHDLVVDTPSMRGGARRAAGAVPGSREFFQSGPEIHHFNYFHDRRSVTALLAGILRRTDEEPAGFTPVRRPEPVVSRAARAQRPADPRRPTVFVLPGIMGTELTVNGESVWLDIGAMADGGIARLGIHRSGVSAGAPMARHYGRLIDRLALQYEVEPWGYDWRRSVREAAAGLDAQVREVLRRRSGPVHFVAHSMGGLVVRALIAAYPSTWRRICERDGRFVMLGTPNGGSHSIIRVLIGHDSKVKLLDLVDFDHDRREVLGYVAAMPGVLELLPRDDGEHRYFEAGPWDRLGGIDRLRWVPPAAAAIEAAGDVMRAVTKSALDPDHVFYIAGTGRRTIDRMTFGDSRFRPLRFHRTRDGDGTVPWASGVPPGVPTWYAPAEHGALPQHEHTITAIADLLARGATSALPPQPARRRAEDAVEDAWLEFDDSDERIDLFPTEEELLDRCLDVHEATGPAQGEPAPVTVSVTHGDLAFARHPVLVGHYIDDSIVSAEAKVDRLLAGRLSLRRDLGCYPGPVGTAECFANDGAYFRGAIVVGLGFVGELSRGDLQAALQAGLLRYVIEQDNWDQRSRRDGAAAQPAAGRDLAVSTLLIGSGEGGVTTRDAVRAQLDAVRQINRKLRDRMPGYRITTIELIEIFRHRAVLAAHLVEEACQDPGYRGFARFEPHHLGHADGGLHRSVEGLELAGWSRLHVTGSDEDCGQLRYLSVQRLARAEVRSVPGRMRLLDSYVERAIAEPANAHAAHTLFELLLPNELKALSTKDERLVLLVDRHTARFPWELIQDRMDARERPLAVNSGMIRQLKRERFRANPLYAAGDEVLVIGDTRIEPPSDGVEGPAYAELPGAQREARAVAGLFRDHGIEPQVLIRAGAHEILDALFARDYRVLHIAAHGEPPGEGPCGAGGVVLDHEFFLTDAEIEKLRCVPELVFVNCCHVGTMALEPQDALSPRINRLAASLAVSLIEMGVRAVVVAGWAVDDALAERFAGEFYRRLFAGWTFGDAVHAARRAVFQPGMRDNTWGAYQCYGDPDFRLADRQDGDALVQREAPSFLSSEDVECALENLVSRLRVAGAGDEALRDELLRVRATIELGECEEWRRSAAILARLGVAFAELGDAGEALRWYDEAAKQNDSALAVRHLEERWALAARAAADGVLEAGEAADEASVRKAIDAVSEAIRRLRELRARYGETPRRCRLIGTALAQLALVRLANAEPRREIRAALVKMRTEFGRAVEHEPADATALADWATGELTVALLDRARRLPPRLGTTLASRLGSAAADADADDRRAPHPARRVAALDLELLHDLATAFGALPEMRRALGTAEHRLEELLRGGASTRHGTALRDRAALLRRVLEYVAPDGETP